MLIQQLGQPDTYHQIPAGMVFRFQHGDAVRLGLKVLEEPPAIHVTPKVHCLVFMPNSLVLAPQDQFRPDLVFLLPNARLELSQDTADWTVLSRPQWSPGDVLLDLDGPLLVASGSNSQLVTIVPRSGDLKMAKQRPYFAVRAWSLVLGSGSDSTVLYQQRRPSA